MSHSNHTTLTEVSSRPRVLIADGHEVTLNGFLRILENNGCDVSEAKTLGEVISKTKESPDLLIIDFASLRDFTLMDLTELRHSDDSLPVMIATSHRDKKTILAILEDGISGFLFKDCTAQELIRCVEATLRGERFFCNEVFDILMEARLTKPGVQSPSHLTSREVDIIKLIVKGHSTSAIAGQLNLSPHTISTHRKNIIRKLKIKSPVELVAHAYDLGLISRTDT